MLAALMRKRPALKFALPAAILAAALIIAFDQATKYLIVEQMNLRQVGHVDVFPGFLSFRMAWNTGVNFGLFSGGGDTARWALTIGAALIGAVLIGASLACRLMPSAIGLGIAAGGAIGNTIDRFNYGAVADFLNVTCCGIDNPWSFNVADIAIFVGFGMLLLPWRDPAPKPAPAD